MRIVAINVLAVPIVLVNTVLYRSAPRKSTDVTVSAVFDAITKPLKRFNLARG
ncbi:MAG: hypothetical protein WAN04_07720 [Candidatus Udaeobacter sp.]